MKTAGLYIHIPFCVRKCPYCGFYSAVGSEDAFDRYTQAVIRAMERYPLDFSASTIYFGGGTPTVMGAARLCRILKAAKERFGAGQREVTVEANPCSVSPDMLSELCAAGFDRISFGVQTTDDRLLKTLGRRHTAREAGAAILSAKRAGFRHISADLMLALPGQSIEDIGRAIERLAGLPIDHLSAYILKIEEGTAFSGRYPDPDDDFAADCYRAMQQGCAQNGFFQYEISNFAREAAAMGFHNLNYWRCGEYLGIGPSAHSFMAGERFFFESDISAFVSADDPWRLAIPDGKGGSDEERLMLGLRLAEGAAMESLSHSFRERVADAAAPLIKAGLMGLQNGRLFITGDGFIVSNSIIAALL